MTGHTHIHQVPTSAVTQLFRTFASAAGSDSTVGDLTTVVYDFMSTGSPEEFLVGAGNGPEAKLIVLRISDRAMWIIDQINPGVVGGEWVENNHVTAWNFVDSDGYSHVYIGPQGAGEQVQEVLLGSVLLGGDPLCDIGAASGGTYVCGNGSAVFQAVGAATVDSLAGWHDGLSCPSIAPFATCGDKSGSAIGPNPDSVTDDECGLGYVYNPQNAHRCSYTCTNCFT